MGVLELALIAALVAGASALGWPEASRSVRIAVLAGGALAVVVALAVAPGAAARAKPAPGFPTLGVSGGAVSSSACRSCHPGEHASWHRSFHRTMTRAATPATVKGPFDAVKLEVEERTIELSRRGDELWARLPDPDLVARAALARDRELARQAPLVSRRVVLATGSHHHEVYWVKGERGNELRLVPITYLIDEKRYVSRKDAFLQPPDAPPHAVRWNSNCVQCHTTLGRPGHDERADRFESEAVELGIACEACHGQGAAHVRKHQNPLVRYAAHFSNSRDDSIVNPARLPADRASELCGQCHAYFAPNDENAWWTDGFATSYAPGDALDRSRTLLTPADLRDSGRAGGPLAEADTASIFWPDGTVRVGGRELNGLVRSACFTRAGPKNRISCLSCHSMHDSDPDDQLRTGESVDAPCRRCHETIARNASAHSHHEEGSPGNACVGCHMPYTSYALFKGIRSHRIDSPSTAPSRPNACNLCHLDRTLSWTVGKLSAWYGDGDGHGSSSNERESTAFALERLLAGDAAERAVVAWAFGLPEAHAASGTSWQAPFLAELLDDPYAAVRKLGSRSLRTLPGFSDFDYDFVAAPEQRRAARSAALERFRALGNSRTDAELLLDASGQPDHARVRALIRSRDQRPVSISE